jgi:hypothetical protein
VSWGIDKTNYAQEIALAATVGASGLRAIAERRGALRALVKCSIGITNLDCDASAQFLAMCARPDPGYGLYERCLAVVDMAGGSDVNAWLKPVFFDVPFRQRLLPMHRDKIIDYFTSI